MVSQSSFTAKRAFFMTHRLFKVKFKQQETSLPTDFYSFFIQQEYPT